MRNGVAEIVVDPERTERRRTSAVPRAVHVEQERRDAEMKRRKLTRSNAIGIADHRAGHGDDAGAHLHR
jgi:hypothetical protein